MLSLIEHLPQNCHYSAALSSDQEYAESLVKSGVELPKPGPPSMASWSPEVNLLAQVIDAVKGVQAAVIASTGTRPSKTEPVARPESALSRVKEMSRQERHEALVALVTRPGVASMDAVEAAPGSDLTFTTLRPD